LVLHSENERVQTYSGICQLGQPPPVMHPLGPPHIGQQAACWQLIQRTHTSGARYGAHGRGAIHAWDSGERVLRPTSRGACWMIRLWYCWTSAGCQWLLTPFANLRGGEVRSGSELMCSCGTFDARRQAAWYEMLLQRHA
jgi:hypothetical protein